MKPTVLSSLFLLALQYGFASSARIDTARAIQRRKSSILIDPDAQPSLPSLGAAKAAANAVGLNLTNIQGDVLIGMKKSKELFFFYSITNPADFKTKLKNDIAPLITSTTQLLSVSTQPLTAVNIAFSQLGLTTLGITDNLADAQFTAGQAPSAAALGDGSTANWVPQFAARSIHGVMLLASDTVENIETTLANVKAKLGNSIEEIYSLQGAARPGAEEGHEHFGYLDGISNPAITGFQTPLPGQAVVPAGEILVGETGDNGIANRPSWAQDGSFMVFRQLQQLVPEFNKFLTDNPIRAPALTPQQGSDLLGARMVGRWKSGAPVFLSPLVDNPALGADPTLNNNFTYAGPGESVASSTDQSKCPFSAHIRKTRPRADLGAEANSKHHVVRGGIPYGPEQTDEEIASNTTSIERGLAFVSYQSSIAAGFQFLQRAWANNPNFVHGSVGFDPIIGAAGGGPRVVNGLDPIIPSRQFTLMIDPPGLPSIPSANDARLAAAAVPGLNQSDIQGDVITGMLKNTELFTFFTIVNATHFKAKLRSTVLPLITSSSQIVGSQPPATAVNIAFSQTGLNALNVTDDLKDDLFSKGQSDDPSGKLNDPGTKNWVPQFTQPSTMHGVVLIAADSVDAVYSLQGAARAKEPGHEHFGFLDGISNPNVIGLTGPEPLPGQARIPPGEILLGEDGDPQQTARPDWTRGGSFLVFRQLEQKVPEFNKFLLDNPVQAEGHDLTPEQGSALFGARMVGRWKSGAPVFLAPVFDDPELGANKSRNNDFTYAEPGQTNKTTNNDQKKCPFSAHIRKTRPRADLTTPGTNETTRRHIVRAGIPYGPDPTEEENASNTTSTSTERGLAFVCYQSTLANGFVFIQKQWASATGFVKSGVGYDPIIGANLGGERWATGLDPIDANRNITMMQDFVVSRGGEYFFSPPISAIATILSA
ncbi:DyP-type peroxidase [Mycena kentingensis (nom. inval.)]|nr:DyP-type peroxidase [Mycena kentingensis (nom. inval.)]